MIFAAVNAKTKDIEIISDNDCDLERTSMLNIIHMFDRRIEDCQESLSLAEKEKKYFLQSIENIFDID